MSLCNQEKDRFQEFRPDLGTSYHSYAPQMHTSARQIYIRVHTGQGAVGNHGLPASPTGTVLTTGTLACRRHSNLRRRIERLGLWARAQPAMRLGSPTVTALCSDAGAAGFRVRPGSRSPDVGMARVPGP